MSVLEMMAARLAGASVAEDQELAGAQFGAQRGETCRSHCQACIKQAGRWQHKGSEAWRQTSNDPGVGSYHGQPWRTCTATEAENSTKMCRICFCKQ